MNDKVWTIKDILLWTTDYFIEKGVESPRLNSEILLSHILNFDRVSLYTNYSRPLSKDELYRYRELIKRRANREPAAYILNRKEFWSIPLKVNRNTLIPRPETEIVVESVNEFIKKSGYNRIVNILEVGTGSGNIPIAIASENKNVNIFSVDISFESLKIAYQNVVENNFDDKIFLINGDIVSSIKFKKFFDIILSNPPYIKTSDIQNLQREVKDFEPLSALDGGSDGLFFYRKILQNSKELLAEGGTVIFEFGDAQQSLDIEKIMVDIGFKNFIIKNDYSGLPRVIRCY